MKLWSLIPLQAHTQLLSAVPRIWEISHVVAVQDAITALRRRDRGTLIVDPLHLSSDALSAVVATVMQTGAVPMLCCDASALSAQVSCETLVNVCAEVVRLDVGTDPGFVVRRLQHLPQLFPASCVLRAIAPGLAFIPPSLHRELFGIFAGGDIPEAVTTLCARAGIARRSVERVLAACGVPSAGRLLAAARVARLWELRAAMVPHQRDHRADRCCRMVTGVPLRQADRLSSSQMAAALLRSLELPVRDHDVTQFGNQWRSMARSDATAAPP
jgi:hypothetical protein